ncbi:serine/threonine protein kinase [Thermobifida halotolerans]|uniref:Serine/threonine protein kinase n=1 Tax=Thermobifida halotolerans TaxID=483545 RepID=A0AA97LXX4_9ACTN|nr:serine/threonine-protein kinase [Thermobifida halotolerans]UOE20257.1 serine/threonine protein kinase [Thermobifida halotolerans]
MVISGELGTVPYTLVGDVDSKEEAEDPERIGGHRIVERIGIGGAAVVYAALSPEGERVAVKILHPAVAADPACRERFAREAALLGRVADEHTAPLVDADVHAVRPWLAMRYVEGPTVGEHVDTDGPLAGVALLEFAAGLAEAVAAVHRSGIVHRDLKPGNIILAADGPKIIDFGIARGVDDPALAGSGEILGSPGWISPEQFHDHVPGPAADVFAWGGLTAYAATGRRPFGSGTVRQTAVRVLNGHADLCGTPRILLPWVEAALSTDPDRRPTSAELAAVIGGLVGTRRRQVHASSSWASISSR